MLKMMQSFHDYSKCIRDLVVLKKHSNACQGEYSKEKSNDIWIVEIITIYLVVEHWGFDFLPLFY